MDRAVKARMLRSFLRVQARFAVLGFRSRRDEGRRNPAS